MIKEKIYNYFDNIRIEKERQEMADAVTFAPSYLSSCKRQVYFKKTKEPESNPIETHSYIKFEMGNSVHVAIQDILKKIGIYEEGEDLKIIDWNGLTFRYRIDGKLKIEDQLSIIEIKSVYAAGYNSIEKEAKSEHEVQLMMYMIFEKINFGTILYIGRDNGFLVEYSYTLEDLEKKYQDFLYKKTTDLLKLKQDIESKKLPDRDNKIVIKRTGDINSFDFQKDCVKYKTDWQCSYCSYFNTCWKSELEEIKKHKFFIDGEFKD
jgi:hypothetical protein